MGKAAAKSGDKITATDTHKVKLPNNTTSPLTFDFNGSITDGLSGNVRINGAFAALVGSGASNSPEHNALPNSFVTPPNNKSTVASGSGKVFINRKAAVRDGDSASTCTEPPTPGNGKVEVANATAATVRFG